MYIWILFLHVVSNMYQSYTNAKFLLFEMAIKEQVVTGGLHCQRKSEDVEYQHGTLLELFDDVSHTARS